MFSFFRRTNPAAIRASVIASELVELQPFFGGHGLGKAPSYGYPATTYLQPCGLNAYHVNMLLSPESWTALRAFVDELLANEPMIKTGKFRVVGADSKLTLAYQESAEFNGHAVVLICNNSDFIRQVQKAQLQPPMPCESFPSVDPQGIGSLQGSMEFWWNSYWLPFWIQLNDQERQRLLSLPQISTGWREFIELHTPGGHTGNPR